MAHSTVPNRYCSLMPFLSSATNNKEHMGVIQRRIRVLRLANRKFRLSNTSVTKCYLEFAVT